MIRLKSGVILTVDEGSDEMPNGAIIVDTVSGKYLSLNKVGVAMIEVAIRTNTEVDAVAALLELFEIDAESLAIDYREFIARIGELNLIE